MSHDCDECNSRETCWMRTQVDKLRCIHKDGRDSVWGWGIHGCHMRGEERERNSSPDHEDQAVPESHGYR